MKKHFVSFSGFLLSALLMLLTLPARGQDFKKMREEIVQKQRHTRSEIDNLNNQIDQYEQRLTLTEKKYDRLYKQFEDLKKVVALEEEKISKLQEEQTHIKEEIDLTSEEIEKNKEKLDQLIENYKRTLSYVYKHGRLSQLALIFSSESINQMLVRSYYLRKFDEYRERQEQQIRQTQENLKRNQTQLTEAREKNSDVLAEIQQEKKKQEQKKGLQEKNVTLLRRDQQQIKSKLDEVRRQKGKLNNTLSSLVMEEEKVRKAQEEHIRRLEEERKKKLAEAKTIEDDERRAREVAKYSTPVSKAGFMDEKTLNKIESDFASEKGKLPWPVKSSTISEHFGRRRHPVYGTVTPNLGIEIVTEPREAVRVIYSGYVVAVQPITGYGDVVVVSHGKYITAYGNLSQVMVHKNAILDEGDIIGLAGDENSSKGSSVFFMVRRNNTNLDPENWLARK